MASSFVRGQDEYNMKRKVGKGEYGDVWEAVKKSTGEVVAIKEIRQRRDGDGLARSAIDEIRLMRETRHPNVLALHDVFQSLEGTLSLVLDFMATDMFEIIIQAKDPKKEPFVPLPPEEIKAYMQMFLSGVRYCHENFILHRDLKPANLLVDKHGVLKLGDFGLARTYGSPKARYSPQAITKEYKPLEMLLGSKKYGPACDMWSVGCIFGEMWLRGILFHVDKQGASDLDQIQRIGELMGSPTDKVWPDMKHLPLTVEFKKRDPIELSEVFRAASEDAVDLLRQLLRYDPNARLSAAKALDHRYFSSRPSPAPTKQIELRVKNLLDGKAAAKRGAGAGMKRKASDSPVLG